MLTALIVLLRTMGLICRGDRAVALENPDLRQQLAAWTRTRKRPQLRMRDRLFWIALAKSWRDWRRALIFVQPETVVRSHHRLQRSALVAHPYSIIRGRERTSRWRRTHLLDDACRHRPREM